MSVFGGIEILFSADILGQIHMAKPKRFGNDFATESNYHRKLVVLF